jgi:hypothetical protein
MQRIFSFTQEFNMRWWDGPSTPPGGTTALPGEVYRIGWDFEINTPQQNPWSVQLAFNPSINSDFESGLSSDAWNLDARGIFFYRTSQYWMWALGAGFWDRVDDRVIPYAGFVWSPDNRWEWRIIFPKPQISYFLGNIMGMQKWLYVRGEYNVEAYEIELQTTGAQEQVEVQDWRVLLGFRDEAPQFTGFLEAGWVFGRDVEYAHGTPGFDPSSGFIVRAGLQY